MTTTETHKEGKFSFLINKLEKAPIDMLMTDRVRVILYADGNIEKSVMSYMLLKEKFLNAENTIDARNTLNLLRQNTIFNLLWKAKYSDIECPSTPTNNVQLGVSI